MHFKRKSSTMQILGQVIVSSVAIWITISGSSQLAANALKLSVSIPELVKLNDAFWLNCSHSSASHASRLHASQPLQQQQQHTSERVYSIRWYKDEEEFYRYLPSSPVEPKVLIYETNGISLDKAKSHEGNVYLTKADVNSEGVYRCEVLAEAPLFETVRKSKHLRVYALPVRGPRIEILDAQGRIKNPKAQEISYDVGDKIELRCNSAPSKPAARLRWYLNDRELPVPATGSGGVSGAAEAEPRRRHANVKVTPIEYKQHYKNIYSSHSTLSLVLQRDDLINSRISFKCLASMRQEVPITSKQLILLTRDSRAARRARRESDNPNDDAIHRPPTHRHRAQYNTRPAAARARGRELEPEVAVWSGDRQQQLAYIYEDSDSTLGPSIIDSPETLDRYLSSEQMTGDWLPASGGSSDATANQTLEFNRADNLEYIQLMRDRSSRTRSLPHLLPGTGTGSGGAAAAAAAGSSARDSSHHKRLYGPNSLVRSPLYLDEFDSLRPVISWPPLEAGRLMQLPGGSLAAVPVRSSKFVMAPGASQRATGADFEVAVEESARVRPLIERLFEQLNCTVTESSLETKLSWWANELPMGARDTRHFPTRVSPDHRQTWLTIGLQSPAALASSVAANSQSSSPLAAILSQFTSASAQSRLAGLQVPSIITTTTTTTTTSTPTTTTDEQLKFACQAIHSMLLYSSSEMITFDFNPPPSSPTQSGDNPIDKLSSSLASNVIPAASASPPRSSAASTLLISLGSQQTLLVCVCLSLAWLTITQSADIRRR